ncbi:MAG TPA: two-component regulator propeller domain-containing protein [Thermoanaerobaculia bacterium]|jgi:ligand-binding sensor domain-containing protein|nr:two-component regulator propeller domain-containing protein [Thermoanaerobaculia bacterium]
MIKLTLIMGIFVGVLGFIDYNSKTTDKASALSQGIAGDNRLTTGGQPKIIKTQGTSQYANVHCGLQDKAGNLWFGTTGEGVYRYDGKSFTNFTEKDGLSSNDVWSIYEDKVGNLLFGTGDGVCRYDSSASLKTGSKTFTALRMTEASENNFDPINPGNSNRSPQSAVWSILQDKAGNFWFGTDEGVFRYNGTSFTRFLHNGSVINNSGLHLKSISSIVEDKSGNIWFASWLREGVCRYDGKTLTSFKPNGDDMVHSILEDKNGNLWFGTRDHGACRYDEKNFTSFADVKIFSTSTVYSMAEDKSGKIWFATENGSGEEGEDGGVWRYDGKSFARFTKKEGLSHNGVFCVVEDKSGSLWFGTRGMGLCRYDGKNFTDFMEEKPRK